MDGPIRRALCGCYRRTILQTLPQLHPSKQKHLENVAVMHTKDADIYLRQQPVISMHGMTMNLAEVKREESDASQIAWDHLILQYTSMYITSNVHPRNIICEQSHEV